MPSPNYTPRRGARAGNSGLRLRLLLLILLPGVLALAVLAWHGSKLVVEFEQAQLQHIRSTARTAEAHLGHQLREGRQFLEMLAWLAPQLRLQQPDQCHQALAAMHANYAQYQNFGFVDREGHMLCSALPGTVDLGDRPFIKRAFETGRFSFGPYQIGRLSRKSQIPLGYPIPPSPQHPAALVFVTVSPEWFEEIVSHQAALPAGTSLAVTDLHGIVIHHVPPGPLLPGEPYRAIDFATLPSDQTVVRIKADRRDGEWHHHVVHRVELGENQLYLVVDVPVDTLLAGPWAINRRALAWIAALAVLTLFLALWGIRVTVMDKLDLLMAMVRRVTAGDLSARAEIAPGRNELCQLAGAVNAMAESLQSQRDLHKAILEAVREGIYGVDEQGKLIFINQTGAEMLGYTPAELIGFPADGVIHHGPLGCESAEAPNGMSAGASSSLFWRKDGNSLPVEYMTSLLFDGHRHRIGTVVAFADVREYRAMGVNLRRSEARFRHLFESAPDAMLITDVHGRIEAANQQAEQMFGYSLSELIGQQVDQLVPQAQREQHARHRHVYYSQPRTRLMGNKNMELSAQRKDGSTLPVAISLSSLRVGDEPKVISSVRDITVPRNQKNELRRREREMSTLTDNLPDLVIRFDLDLCCLFANALAEKMAGMPRSAMVGRPWGEIAALATLAEACLPLARQTLADGQAREHELSCTTAVGTRHLDIRLVPEPGNSQTPATLLLIGRDMTEEKAAVAAIHRNEIRLARSQEVIPFGYWEWNRKTGLRHWSPELFHILGLKPNNNGFEAFLSVVHPDDRQRVRDTINSSLANGKRYQLEYRIVRPDGAERTILEIGDAIIDAQDHQIGIEGPLFDMTERRELQDTICELRQSLEQQLAQHALAQDATPHDFSMPMRAVDRLSRMLLDEEKEMLSRIQLPEDTAVD